LLASPHHGERWAQHWLDVVRYAESNGYEADGERPNAWRYRDYVVRSLNEDKPYDRFLTQQIAGDLLAKGAAREGSPGPHLAEAPTCPRRSCSSPPASTAAARST